TRHWRLRRQAAAFPAWVVLLGEQNPPSGCPFRRRANENAGSLRNRRFVVSSRKRSDVFGRPGGDLLSQALRLSTIGAKGFNGRVRDGIGFWVPCNYHQIGEKHLSEFWLILFLTRRAHASHASSLVSDRLNHAA